MKILLITLLLSSKFVFSQKITDQMKIAFETDNSAALIEEIKTKNFNLNDCFELKEKPYSLFAIAIKMNKQKIFQS